MAVYESGYPSLIQGASQQVPDKRLDGQVSNQLNMVSDALTGLRRRKGFELLRFLENSDDARFWWFSISGASYLIAHDYSTGSIRVYSDKGILVGSIQNDYLIGAYQDFQYTSVSGLGAVLNTQVLPKMQTIQERKYLEGFIDVVTGEVEYDWDITVVHVTKSNQAYTSAVSVHNGDGVTSNADRPTKIQAGSSIASTTGGSGSAGDMVSLVFGNSLNANDNYAKIKSALSSAGYFVNTVDAAFMVTANGMAGAFAYAWYNTSAFEYMRTNFNLYIYGSNIFIQAKDLTLGGTLEIKTSSSSKYIRTTGVSTNLSVNSKDDLPAVLPDAAAGFVLGIGSTEDTMMYYKYIADTRTWMESSKYGQITAFTNMPFVFEVIADADDLVQYISTIGENTVHTDFSSFEVREPDTAQVIRDIKGNEVQTNYRWLGRTVGNETNNETPDFVDTPFTGIGGYQGRLVLMSGAYVHMSASNKYNVLMRTTTDDVLDSDPIHVLSINASGQDFKHAVEFNKDLVLIADNQQAVIGGSTIVLTPQNTVIYKSSVAPMNTSHPPIMVGRDLIYTVQNTMGYSQVGQLQVNNLVENQFNPQIISAHLPKYLKGNIKFSAGTSLSGTIVFGTGTKELLVWQYIADQSEVLQSAFGLWELPYPVVYAWFISDIMFSILKTPKGYALCSVSTTRGVDDTPYLDLWVNGSTLPNSKGTYSIPKYLRGAEFMLSVNLPDTDMHLDEVGYEVQAQSFTLVRSFSKLKDFFIGLPFTSSWEPSAPIMRDQKDITLTDKATLLRYTIMVNNTGSFNVKIKDGIMGVLDIDSTALTWSNTELGKSRINTRSTTVIPCRTLARTTSCVFSTSSTYDMNVLQLGYTFKLSEKRRRWNV